MEIRGVDSLRGVTQETKVSKAVRRSQGDAADAVEISHEARQLATATKIEDVVRQTPEVREDRIAEVKAKLERGEYNNEEVMNAVAERIMKALGL